MSSVFSTCEGSKCPSKANCRRHTERNYHESIPAALWVRREAGASACDMYVPVEVVSTFKTEQPKGENHERSADL